MPKNKKPFRLSQKAEAELNKATAAIREGVRNVCELHTHDTAPSVKQTDFELLYIEKVFSPIITAVSAGIKNMAEGLARQKEAEVAALKAAAETEQAQSTERENI